MKTTYYHIVEQAYFCPHCDREQGYTDWELDYGVKTCNYCKFEFRVEEK